MSLSDLPPEVLENIFSNLRFDERKILSEVCRMWHNVIFNVMPVDYKLRIYDRGDLPVKLEELLVNDNIRTYRNVSIELYFESIHAVYRPEFFNEVDACLNILKDRGTIRYLRLESALGRRLWEFFGKHKDLLDSLEELKVVLEERLFSEINLEGTLQELSLSKLKCLIWDENEDYGTTIFDEPVFEVNIPCATRVTINRNDNSRDKSLVAITKGDNIEQLTIGNMDEPCAREVFQYKHPNLLRLALQDSVVNETDELEDIAQNIPNLTSLHVGYSYHYDLQAVTFALMLPFLTSFSLNLQKIDLYDLCKRLRYLTNLEKLILRCHNDCEVHRTTILTMPNLIEFHSNMKCHSSKKKHIKLDVPALQSFYHHQNDLLSVAAFSPLTIDHPELRELDFQWIPSYLNFFQQQSFINLRILSLCIPGIQQILADEIDGRFHRLQHLTLQLSEVDHPDVNLLLFNVFRNCVNLTRLHLDNFAISFDTFAGIVNLSKLHELHLLHGKILGPVERHLTVVRLKLLTVSKVTVTDDRLDSFLIRTATSISRSLKDGNSLNGTSEPLRRK